MNALLSVDLYLVHEGINDLSWHSQKANALAVQRLGQETADKTWLNCLEVSKTLLCQSHGLCMKGMSLQPHVAFAEDTIQFNSIIGLLS